MRLRRCWKWFGGIAAVALCSLVVLPKLQQRVPQSPVAEEQTADPLPEADLKFLWNAESLGLELGQFGWPQLSDAICAADADAIQAVFADEFHAKISSQPKRIEIKRDF